MITLRMLEYLVAVADQGHFGRAARACHVSQPTLSQQLRLLEERLGVVLVDRGARSIELTPIGREVLSRARRVLKEMKDLQRLSQIARQGSAALGVLRIGASPTIGPYLLPRVVARLHAERPHLKLHVREGIPDEQMQRLIAGEIDLLLSPLPLAAPLCAMQVVMREPLRLVAAQDHPFARRAVLAAAELAGASILNLDPRHHLARKIETVATDLDLIVLHDYEGTSLDSIHQMAATGLGLAILPELYLASDAGGKLGVSVLPLRDYAIDREIALFWRQDAPYQETCLDIAARLASQASEIIDAASYRPTAQT